MRRLAVIATHPIQYYAPWFKYLTANTDLFVKVFYLWDFGVTLKCDRAFKTALKWDEPLLSGYRHSFIPNYSFDPGTHNIFGLRNPDLANAVKAFEPDAVLCTAYNYFSIYSLLLDPRFKSVPFIFRGDSHRITVQKGLKAYARKLWITKVFKRFDKLLYVGAANKEYFNLHGVEDRKLCFSPHAIDNERFSLAASKPDKVKAWRKELGISEDDTLVLFAGKFISKKCPLELLAAFNKAKLKNTSLLFVGSGPLEKALKQRAANNKKVYFAPFQNQSLMPVALMACDILTLPSYGPDESWGLIVNEAFAVGRPALVSSHVGCRQDLIKEGETGLSFEAGSVSDLARALVEACGDRERLKLWGQNAKELIAGYSYKESTKGLLEALEDLKSLTLSPPHAPAPTS